MNEHYLTPEEVCRMVPGITLGGLRQLRYKGRGPAYVRASPRRIVYAQSAIETWLAASTVEPRGAA